MRQRRAFRPWKSGVGRSPALELLHFILVRSRGRASLRLVAVTPPRVTAERGLQKPLLLSDSTTEGCDILFTEVFAMRP